MALTDLTIVTKSLKARLFSTVTTVLLVGVAVGLMLVLVSMRDSARRAFDRGTGNMHILVSADSSPLTSVLNSIFYANPPARALPWDTYLRLAADPRLAFALPVQQGDSFRGFPTTATLPEFFEKFQPERGEPFRFAQGGPLKDTFDVVLGAEAAAGTGLSVGDKLFITHGVPRRSHEPTPGDTPATAAANHDHDHDQPHAAQSADVHIHDEHPFTVVGILEPTASPHDRAVFITLDASWVAHADDLRQQEASGSGKPAEEPTPANLRPDEKLITGIYLAVRGREDAELPPLVPVLFSELRKDGSLTVALPGQQILTLFRIVGNIDRIILAIAAAVMVSSSIAIMLAIYNSMNERRRQIAVLRVLGASKGRIFALILSESAVIGLLGSAAGVAFCAVGSKLVAAAMKDRLGLVIAPDLPMVPVLVVVAGAVVLACLAGVIPAISAYRTSVIRNLRPAA